VRHRQTKGAATDMFDLPPPRHISTLRDLAVGPDVGEGLLATTADLCSAAGSRNVLNSLNRPMILSLRRLREH
jgi:hypothetical protein